MNEPSIEEVIARTDAAAQQLLEANAVYVDADSARTELVSLLELLIDASGLRVMAQQHLDNAGVTISRGLEDTDVASQRLVRFSEALEDALALGSTGSAGSNRPRAPRVVDKANGTAVGKAIADAAVRANRNVTAPGSWSVRTATGTTTPAHGTVVAAGSFGGHEAPVSAAFQPAMANVTNPDLRQKMSAAFQLIDSVHRDGQIPPIADVSDQTAHRGEVKPKLDQADGKFGIEWLRVNPAAATDITALHEIGHVLDVTVFAAGGKAASNWAFEYANDNRRYQARLAALRKAVADGSSPSPGARELGSQDPGWWRTELDMMERVMPPMMEWARAVQSSPMYLALTSARDLHAQVIRGRGVPLAPADEKFVQYVLDPRELWARSYGQWIATKSRYREGVEWADKAGHGPIPEAWTTAEFGPIAGSIERMIGELGWM